jgi:hypothetical protein
MEFKTAAQKACYEKIAPWMKEIFGDFAMVNDKVPAIGVAVGSAFAQVGVMPWGDDDTTINTRAYVVSGAELSQDLTRYLLEENAKLRFGAFSVDSDGDIVFEHGIVGSSCDKKELKASVMAVVTTADKYDDEIVRRWGGQRALDRKG